MKTITLNVSRDKSLVGAGMSYRIFINDKEVAKLRIGKTFSCQLPGEQFTLRASMVGNALSFHKIGKEVVVFPEYSKSGVINCKLRTRQNWLGFLTLGMFQAIGRTEIEVLYQ